MQRIDVHDILDNLDPANRARFPLAQGTIHCSYFCDNKKDSTLNSVAKFKCHFMGELHDQ